MNMMTPFGLLGSSYMTLILSMLLIAAVLQLVSVFVLHRFHRMGLMLWNILLFIALFLLIPVLGHSMFNSDGFLRDMPVAVAMVIGGIYIVNGMATIYYALSQTESPITPNSVKEAFDTLPTGICFFTKKGLPVLCNEKMYHIAYMLMGRDLQVLSEIEEACDSPAEGVEKIVVKGKTGYRLQDATVWSFSKTVVRTGDREEYIQLKATDFTDLYSLQEELESSNEELEDMIGQVKRISENMSEIVRQQEILTAKMRIHNKMGNCLLSTKQYLGQGLPTDKKDEFLRLWDESLSSLMEEASAGEEPDACSEVIRIAKSIGISVITEGELPHDNEKAYLLVVALRECVTNALRHAAATELYMKISEDDSFINAEFSNNGEAPDKEIVPGGGLSSLKERIEKAGGEMLISSTPGFVLTVRLPVR
ncbi:MAG: hypothetical protein Q4B67_04180 [Eubacteriales bacterium]|nr:hypothetical protein [Eubacteriales bacterium]